MIKLLFSPILRIFLIGSNGYIESVNNLFESLTISREDTMYKSFFELFDTFCRIKFMQQVDEAKLTLHLFSIHVFVRSFTMLSSDLSHIKIDIFMFDNTPI